MSVAVSPVWKAELLMLSAVLVPKSLMFDCDWPGSAGMTEMPAVAMS